MATLKDLELKVKVDTGDVEKALVKLKKAMDDVSKTEIEVSITQVMKKKWWEFWK